jgi:hypothetical protein
MMEGPGADSEEKHEPVSDIDTAVVVVGLKALDPEWPIREAIDPSATLAAFAYDPRVVKWLLHPLICQFDMLARSIAFTAAVDAQCGQL